MKTREAMMEGVLEDPGLQRTMESLSRAGEGDEQALQERARKYFLEIASDFNGKWLRIWELVLRLVWRAIYDDFVVDPAGMATIKEIAGTPPFVVIPCHRSHADYLLLSYILYKNGISLPFVAAGDNMNFWPLGAVFRQSGAFFLRRRFRGNELYGEVFATYLKHLLKDGVPVEFFLEGGRSRTGKMAAPRYGMLSMLIRAYNEGVCDELALIPVYIGYDRIIEENSYLKELSGVPKRRESVLDIIKHGKIIMRRYGRVYINVGNPISLKSYFAALPTPFAEISSDDKQALYRDIGFRVASEINRISVATPVAVVAAVLLCRTEKEISGELLTATFTVLSDYLNYKKVKIAPALALGEDAMPAVLELFNKWGYLSLKKEENDRGGNSTSYLIPEGKRLNLEYYKNNIIHHFLSVSLAALSILSCREKEIDLSRISDDCLFLKNLFRQEFIFGGDADGEIEETLSYLGKSGIIEKAEERMAWKPGVARDKLIPFAGLLRSYLESYWIVLNAFSTGEKKLTGEKDLLNYLRRLAEGMYEKGDIGRAESLSQENYKNALKFLQGEGILGYKNSTGKEKMGGGVSVDENRMENLRFRLSNFM